MKIAALGAGMARRALAGRLTELGHEVTVGTRDVAATTGGTGTDAMGNPSFSGGPRPGRRCAWRPSHEVCSRCTACRT
jgi:hypothetical protein